MDSTTTANDTLRSGDPQDFVASAVCLETNDGDTTAVDATIPPPGMINDHLVRAEGSLGVITGGTPRPGRSCP